MSVPFGGAVSRGHTLPSPRDLTVQDGREALKAAFLAGYQCGPPLTAEELATVEQQWELNHPVE
jgi:hypothetical protein